MSSDERGIAPSGADWSRDTAVSSGTLSGADWDEPIGAGTNQPSGTDWVAVARLPPRAKTQHPFAAPAGGRYQLGAELGVGGMGIVRSARDTRLDRDVAYKHVAKHAHERAGIGDRFIREARITAFLEHPAIVPIYDAGESAEGEPFYTMRLVRGRSLGDAVTEATDLQARLRLLRHFLDACEAVAYAHRQGVVHRDLKPDNIMVGEFGETQVVDWGLARWDAIDGLALWAAVTDSPRRARSAFSDVSPDEGGGASNLDSIATQDGSVVGTPAYMSPEQARGGAADTRSDVWSLGVMLWQVIAGAHPLAGQSSDEILAAVRSFELPSLQSRCKDAPAELCAIVAHAMEADPVNRYQDAKALAEDVARYIDGRLVQVHMYSPAEQLRRMIRVYRAPLLVAAVALLLLVVVGGLAVRRTQLEHSRALSAETVASSARISADHHLAQALVQHAQAALQVDARAEAEIFAIEALSRAESPDARGVLAGFAFAPRPRLVDRTPMPRCIEVRPSPRGDIFLCLQAEKLSLWQVTPTGVRQLWIRRVHAIDAAIIVSKAQVLVSHGRGETSRLTLSDGKPILNSKFLSPLNGEFEAATSHEVTLSAFPSQSFVFHADMGRPILFLPCPASDPLISGSLSNGSDRVASMCGSGLLVISDANTGKTLRTAFLRDLGDDSRGITALAWMPDDKGIIAGARNGSVAFIDVDHLRVVRRARLGLGETREVRPHPTRPMVAVMGERGGVLLWNPHTGVVQGRLPAGWSDTLRFSPDATQLLCYGAELRRWRLPIAPRPLRFWSLPNHPGLSAVALSPDGKTIALMPGSGELNVIRVADGKVILKDRFQSMVLKGGSFDATGKRLMVYGVANPSVRIYDTQTWKPIRTYPQSGCKRSFLLSNNWLLAAHYGSLLKAYSPDPSEEGVKIASRYYLDGAQTENRSRVFFLSQMGRVDQVDANSPPTLTNLFVDRAIRRIASDPNGEWLALARRRDLVIRRADLRGPDTTIALGDGRVFDVALSRNAQYVAVGNLRRTARVWRVADRTLVATLRGHSNRVSHVSFNSSGDYLLTGSWDGSARLWDMRVLSRPAVELAAEVRADWGLTLEDALNTPFR